MYFKDIIGQEEIKNDLYIRHRQVSSRTPSYSQNRLAQRFPSGTGLRTLSELHEPDGNRFMRALSVMLEV